MLSAFSSRGSSRRRRAASFHSARFPLADAQARGRRSCHEAGSGVCPPGVQRLRRRPDPALRPGGQRSSRSPGPFGGVRRSSRLCPCVCVTKPGDAAVTVACGEGGPPRHAGAQRKELHGGVRELGPPRLVRSPSLPLLTWRGVATSRVTTRGHRAALCLTGGTFAHSAPPPTAEEGSPPLPLGFPRAGGGAECRRPATPVPWHHGDRRS